MEEITSLECIWRHLKNSEDVISLSQCCKRAFKAAMLFRPFDLLMYQQGPRLTKFLDYFSYEAARSTCNLWSRCLPASGLEDRLDSLQFCPNELPENVKQDVAEGVRTALSTSRCFKIIKRHSVVLEPDDLPQILNLIPPLEVCQYNASSAKVRYGLEKLKFKVPAGKALEAELSIGGFRYWRWSLPAKDKAWSLEDKPLTLPLMTDYNGFDGGLVYHGISLTTNCPCSVDWCLLDQTHPLPNFSVLQDDGGLQAVTRILHYLSLSKFCLIQIPLAVTMSGMFGFRYTP